MLALYVEELVTGTLHTVHEVIAKVTDLLLVLERRLHGTRSHWRDTTREHDTLAGLHLHLEITRNVKVLVEVVTTLKFLHVLDTTIPVRRIHELVLLVELHVEIGVVGIHAHTDTVLNLLIATIGYIILMCILTHAAESAERTQTQSNRCVRLQEGVTNKDSVLVMYKGFLFLKPNATHVVYCGRHALPGKLANVLVASWAEVVTIILVQTKIELRTVQHYSLIER